MGIGRFAVVFVVVWVCNIAYLWLWVLGFELAWGYVAVRVWGFGLPLVVLGLVVDLGWFGRDCGGLVSLLRISRACGVGII